MKMPVMAVTAVLLFAATTVQAQPYGGGYYPYSRGPAATSPRPQATAPAEVETPEQILGQGLDRMKGFLAQGAGDPKEILAFLDNQIAPYFDFQLMSKWVIGPGFNRLGETEKNEFTQRLKVMFFSALSKNLKAFTNPPPQIDIFSSRGRANSRQTTVNVLVRGGFEQPTRLQFRFYRGTSGWKIFDVTANGISAVSYYRRHFNQARHPYFVR